MHNTEHTASGEAMETLPSRASNRSRGKHLLNAGLAALAAGFAASLMAAALMGVLRLEAGIPTPVELFGDHVLKLLPAGRFVQFLITFGRNAKTEPLGLTLLGMIGLGTLLGLLYAPLVRLALPASGYRPARREWLVAAGLAMVMTVAAVALFCGELGQNFLGLPLAWAMLVTALAMLAEFSLYAATLCMAYRALLPKQPAPGVFRTGTGTATATGAGMHCRLEPGRRRRDAGADSRLPDRRQLHLLRRHGDQCAPWLHCPDHPEQRALCRDTEPG